MRDTNGLITIIRSNILTAISWAEADKQASEEGGYAVQASDDAFRISLLKEALERINDCFKE